VSGIVRTETILFLFSLFDCLCRELNLPVLNLSYLLHGVSGLVTTGLHERDFGLVEITGVTTDPDLCKLGYIYVADVSESVDSTRLGERLDGRDFIGKAIENGASVIITTSGMVLPAVQQPPYASASPILLFHEEPLSVLGSIASHFNGGKKPQYVAMVTGTNGKTSTVNFARMLWAAAHLKSCSIGNLGGVMSDGQLVWDRDETLSVPETVTLHQIMRRLSEQGVERVAMEATSHALFDHRLTGLTGSVGTIGAFSNITRDHLDFHGTMDEYFRVKMTLFSRVLPPGSSAVLNADAERFEEALSICQARGHKIISYGFNGAELRLVDCEDVENGQNIVLEIFGVKYQCHFNLSGQFQVSNMMCALSIVIASGIAPAQAISLIPHITEVEGRLNTVAHTSAGGRVIVDYAHSSHALRAALEAARSLTTGKLTVVFGCGGERDEGKRKEMGEVAAKIADHVIVTDDNPRREDPALIRRAVLAGAPQALEIENRVKAIEAAMQSLKHGDTLLIAGKGHETTQTIGTESFSYSDIETAKRLAGELLKKGTL
jgi:UDP-N-acetylmuramoyl-L-alanyl-D-glutamate--2,6-diaminopimelate ligase